MKQEVMKMAFAVIPRKRLSNSLMGMHDANRQRQFLTQGPEGGIKGETRHVVYQIGTSADRGLGHGGMGVVCTAFSASRMSMDLRK